MGFLNAKNYIARLNQNKELIDRLYVYRNQTVTVDELIEYIQDNVPGLKTDIEELLVQLHKENIVVQMNGTVMLDTNLRMHLESKLRADRRPDARYEFILEQLMEEVEFFNDAREAEKPAHFEKVLNLMQQIPNQVEDYTEQLSGWRNYIITIENTKEKFKRLANFNARLEKVLKLIANLAAYLNGGIGTVSGYEHRYRQIFLEFVEAAKRSIRTAQDSTAAINDDVMEYIHRYVRNAAFYRKMTRLYEYVKNNTLESETDIERVAEDVEYITPEFYIFRNIDPENRSESPDIDDILDRVADKLGLEGEDAQDGVDIPMGDGVPERIESFQVDIGDVWESFRNYSGRTPGTDLCSFIFSLKFEKEITVTEAIAIASNIIDKHVAELEFGDTKGTRTAYSRVYGNYYRFEYPVIRLNTL